MQTRSVRRSLTLQSMTRSSSPSDTEPKIYQWDNAATPSVSPARENLACVRLEEVVALPRRSPLTAELKRALAAASTLHGLRSDLSPVPVIATATITEAGAYRFRLRDPIDLRVSRVGGRSALGFLHELGICSTTRSSTTARHARGRRRSTRRSHRGAMLRRCSRSGSCPAAIRDNATSSRCTRSGRAPTHIRCYCDPRIACSTGDSRSCKLKTTRTSGRPTNSPPVAIEVELAFERLGLRQLSLPLAA